MEVLEIANVELFCSDEVVVAAAKRSELLCVVWEGTLAERESANVGHEEFDFVVGAGGDDNSELSSHSDEGGSVSKSGNNYILTVWHAGDWTGPVALQPDFDRSADKNTQQRPRDIVAVSKEGVKVRSFRDRTKMSPPPLISCFH